MRKGFIEWKAIRRYTSTAVLLCIAAIAPHIAIAQDSSRTALAWYQTVQLNGLVSTSYNYNFNRPYSRTNQLRVFDIDNNSMMLDLVELVFHRDPNKGEAGFRVDMDAGSRIPQLTHSVGLAMGDFDLHQIYLSYIDSIGRGLRFDIGKFVTLPGLEVIEGYDGFNPNHSHSFLFGYAIPYTHTGIKVSYPFSDAIGITGMLVNGWDNSIDMNDAKTVGLQVAITPSPEVSVVISGITGAEQPRNNRDLRSVIDLAATFKPIHWLTLSLSADYGMEEAVDAGKDVTWKGAAGYIRWSPSAISLTIRSEVFDDPSGYRTGVAQRLTEITITPEYQVNKNFILRGDFRIDGSTKNVFEKRSGLPITLPQTAPTNTQTTASLNAIFVF